MSNSRSHYWPFSVDEIISKLEYMDSVTVVWLDASQSSNVLIPKKGSDFANHTVETRVSSTGRFIKIQKGEAYNDFHILILKDISDQRRGTAQSIPLCLTKQIMIHGHGKEQLISFKQFGALPQRLVAVTVAANTTKMKTKSKSKSWNKSEIHFVDGSTKRIGAF
ncbi:MAG: hypothetical protein ACYC9R_12190 [Nitrosotalea sp.]